MRKFFISGMLAALMLPGIPALAAFEGPGSAQPAGSYSGPISGAMAETVAQARELPDDSPVVLTGNIISQIAGTKDKFVFKDQSGEIRVDINKKALAGQNITPQDRVRISGKVDKDFGEETEIDAKQILVLKP